MHHGPGPTPRRSSSKGPLAQISSYGRRMAGLAWPSPHPKGGRILESPVGQQGGIEFTDWNCRPAYPRPLDSKMPLLVYVWDISIRERSFPCSTYFFAISVAENWVVRMPWCVIPIHGTIPGFQPKLRQSPTPQGAHNCRDPRGCQPECPPTTQLCRRLGEAGTWLGPMTSTDVIIVCKILSQHSVSPQARSATRSFGPERKAHRVLKHHILQTFSTRSRRPWEIEAWRFIQNLVVIVAADDLARSSSPSPPKGFWRRIR